MRNLVGGASEVYDFKEKIQGGQRLTMGELRNLNRAKTETYTDEIFKKDKEVSEYLLKSLEEVKEANVSARALFEDIEDTKDNLKLKYDRINNDFADLYLQSVVKGTEIEEFLLLTEIDCFNCKEIK